MESIKVIKNRIRSIVSTRQITRSMRLVSTAKVQRVRARMNENRPFREQTEMLVGTFKRCMADDKHPLIIGNGSEKAAVIVLAADRGLCGGYNVNAGRAAAALAKKLGDVRLITVGTKARDFCRRRVGRDKIAHSYIGVSENPFYEDAAEIAALVLDWYRSGEIGSVHLIYTEFVNMLVQETKAVPLLPLNAHMGGEGIDVVGHETAGEAFLEALIPFFLSSSIYGAMLESSACEQSSRVTSMDSAVKNSDAMIEKLTLLYNQARQGRITQEIIEITGGADAVQ